MNRWKLRPSVRFWCVAVALSLSLGVGASLLRAQSFPQYNHVFLLTMENENYNQVIGNQNAPILNALAQDYGLATNYRGVADPSEPNLRGHAWRRLLWHQQRRPLLVSGAHGQRE